MKADLSLLINTNLFECQLEYNVVSNKDLKLIEDAELSTYAD